MMLLAFLDSDLESLEVSEEKRTARLSEAIVRAFRKAVRIIRDAKDERDIRAMKSLRMEQLKGDRKGQHSLRLNDQWRLIIQIAEDQEIHVIQIVEISDHYK